MANTYTQIHIQTVFAVRNRQCLINKNWEDDLYKYITGIIQNNDHKLLQINGMPDHIHIFFGMRPKQSLSDLMKKVKEDSSKWINKKGFLDDRFSWQAGYGGFSYAKSEVPQVIRYIQKQKEHHKKKTFPEEYLNFLKSFDIDYDERYLFKPVL
ncbi:MAG: IS200/IS605 family transposase [Gammaproteobacteria bacterium]|nr:IS200/IS605 family transposase [Gammaproteobacteria bacterium]